MNSPQPRYPNAKVFREAITARIKTEANRRGRLASELRREFLYQRFLARVFHPSNGDQWVLKGGVGLLIRLPIARFSQDIDLYNINGLKDAMANLSACVLIPDLDLFAFQLGKVTPMAGAVTGTTVTIEAYLGATPFGNFTIDLSTDLEHVGVVETFRPAAVIDIADISPPPIVRLCALSDQIVDKVCAMYSSFSGRQLPSTRYRDLVDLVLIVQSSPINAAETRAALAQQAQVRALTLPIAMRSPGAAWATAYPQQAAQTPQLLRELRNLDAALKFVAHCLDPLLDGSVAVGMWDPAAAIWTPSPG